jgi:hypothetical protein
MPAGFVFSGEVACTALDRKPKRGPRLRRVANIEGHQRAYLLVDRNREDWSALWWYAWMVVDGASPTRTARPSVPCSAGTSSTQIGHPPVRPRVDIAR